MVVVSGEMGGPHWGRSCVVMVAVRWLVSVLVGGDGGGGGEMA